MPLLFRILFISIILSLLGCSKPSESEFNIIGFSKDEVRKKFNEPGYTVILTKENIQSYMGPRPKFINTMKPNEKVEIWSYHVEEGYVHLYFRSENKVAGKVLFRKEVMY